MTKLNDKQIDWNNAPEWATSYAKLKNKDWYYYLNDKCYAFLTNLDEVYEYGLTDESTEHFLFGDFDVLEERPVKPVFTQAMADNGELPPVGSEFMHKGVLAVALSTSAEHDGVVTFTTDNGCSVECCWNNDAWVKPVDTKTDKEKLFDEINSIPRIYIADAEEFLNKIVSGKLHGVTFTGTK